MSNIRSWRIPGPACTPALLALVLAVGGCMAKSMAPAVDRNDRVVDRGLVGSWRADDTEQALIELRDSGYAILYTEKNGKRTPLVGTLGRLGTRWILDLAPDESGLAQASDAYKAFLIPVHSFAIIDSIAPRMRVSLVKEDSLEKYLKREPGAVAHVGADDPVLTAPTPELRAFLERYIARPGVLESSVWTKR